ncbi:MAG: hypothetical protein DCC57_13530, partial [Chloroflexi bacterium]
MIHPMTLPPNFDPGAALPAKTTEYGTFHEVRAGASLAAQLVANGAAQDIDLAHVVLEAVLRCQERDPRDPHLGAFRWMAEDTWIEDLNAVTFVLRSLIPMMIRHGDRLRPPLHGRVMDAIRLGLGEIARLDVLPAYTNITALDIANTCLGGELLHDPALLARGRAKLAAWIEFTNRSGHPHEFNSPTYLPVSIRALGGLAELSRGATTRSRARAMLARLGLSAVLHLHHASGRWAGPYGRAYQPTITTGTPPERTLLDEWIAGGLLPGWLGTLWAALITTGLTDGWAGVRDLVARFFRWRVGLGWYAVALLGPAAYMLAGVGLHAMLTGETPTLPIYALPLGQAGLMFLQTVALGMLLNTEEWTWRGVALPLLQNRHGALIG